MSIFKAYDVRGVYPDEIDEQFAYAFGRAFVRFLDAKTLVLGRDMRQSSNALFSALAEGAADQGAEIINIGLCTTPMLYFTVGDGGYDGGIMISASHNPAAYNGFKLVRESAIPISNESGMQEIRKLMEKRGHEKRGKGKIRTIDILPKYIKHMIKLAGSPTLKPFKIVVDSANGMSSPLVKKFSIILPGELIHLYPELDGSFPNHEANPIKTENLEDLRRSVHQHHADIGIAFDGDADRVAFVDEKALPVPSDLITALVAAELLKQNQSATIMYDLRSSRAVKEEIEKYGGKAVMCRVGHSLIKAQMRKEDALFAGELSGHYYYQHNYYVESPFFIILEILRLLSTSSRPLSEHITPLRKYYPSGEINSKVEDKKAKMQELAKKYADARNIFYLDGISIEYDEWWMNVRPSNTEPYLRLNLEARTPKLMQEKRDEVLTIIRA